MTSLRALVLATMCGLLVGCGDAAKKAGDAAKKAGEAAKDAVNLKVGDVDLGAKFKELTESITSTLGGVKDADTAMAAVPELEKANEGLGEVMGLADKLPAAAKPAFEKMVAGASSALGPIVQKVLALDGVSGILKPILDKITGQFSAFTGGGES